jgi:hypothetical protein
MKNLYPFILALLSFTHAGAQNLVSNGDFETYTSCPTGLSQTANCIGWRAFTTGGSSDYFNCSISPFFVSFGYQPAASGTGYMGGYSFTGTNQTSGTYKEYVAGLLGTPMQIGVTYEVSLSVNLSNHSNWGCSDIGVYFYDNGPLTYPGNSVPPVTPQVSFASMTPITDTQNWVRLTANFYADSAYDNIVVGSWLQSANASKLSLGGTNQISYYYYDSIVVKVATKISTSYSDSLWCAGDMITVPYTVNQLGYFNSGNVFTLQLSDASGSFATPTTLATQAGTTSGSFTLPVPNTITPGSGYRIRVRSSNPVDSSNISLKPITIGVVKPAKPVITSNSPVCNGQTLTLNATTTTAGVNYKWTGPNSFTSNIQNPSVTNVGATHAGDYIVTTWLYGCNARDTETVVVNSAILPITASSNSPVCEGQTLNLFSTNGTAGSTYSWTGPNSFTSSIQNPTISNTPLAADGDYIVTAMFNGCVVKDTVTVQVKPLPANFSATSNAPICTTSPLNLFGNTTSAGVTFSWTGPNSFSSILQNPVLNPVGTNASGDYILTATLNGCAIKDTTTVVVSQAPAAGIIASLAANPVCQNTTLQLNSSNTLPGTVYSWTGPNSFTSSLQNPSVAPVPLAGNGDYIVSATLNGCVIKDTVTATILAAPTNINATSNSAICDGQTLNLNVTNGTIGVSYAWTGPNSFTSALQNPSVAVATTSASGNYIATLSINGCTLKDTVAVIVHPIPAAPTAGSNTPVCNNNPINLTATAGATGTAYQWTGPNSFTSSVQNPTINNANISMTGSYSVTATLNGCTSPAASTNVTVLYFPSSVTVYPVPNDTICVGGTIQFVAVASNGGANPQFRWMKNGSLISGATAISYTTGNIITGDKITAILTPDNTCPDPDTSSDIEVAVLPYVTPSVTITASPGTLISPWQTITFTATPVNGGKNPTYQWKRNGQNLVGAVNDTWGAYTLSNNDTISVEMFSSEYCPSPASAMSNKIVVAVKTGVEDIKNEEGFVLYPNPNNGTFTLKGNVGNAKVINAEIWSSLGQLVYRNTLQPRDNVLNAEVVLDRSLAAGVYLLKLKTTEGTQLLRFTISR